MRRRTKTWTFYCFPHHVYRHRGTGHIVAPWRDVEGDWECFRLNNGQRLTFDEYGDCVGEDSPPDAYSDEVFDEPEEADLLAMPYKEVIT